MKRNLEGFAAWCIARSFEGLDMDGGELQESLIEFGLIEEVEGGFDPEVHHDEHGCADAGDTWYVATKDVQFLTDDQIERMAAIATEETSND